MDSANEKQITDKQPTVSSKLLQRIIFDWMLLIGIFLSFTIFTAVEQSAYMHRSLSGLGWRVGKLGRLFFYTFFTIGFFIYQVRLFTKQSGRKHHTINWIMYVGSLILLIGACMPIGSNREAILDILHSRFCQIGTAAMALSVGLMSVAYCRETKTTLMQKAMIIVPCFAVLFLGTLGLFKTGRPGAIVTAIFTLMATFMVMVYTHYLTVSYELAEKSPIKSKTVRNKEKHGKQKNSSTFGN